MMFYSDFCFSPGLAHVLLFPPSLPHIHLIPAIERFQIKKPLTVSKMFLLSFPQVSIIASDPPQKITVIFSVYNPWRGGKSARRLGGQEPDAYENNSLQPLFLLRLHN